MFLIWSFGRKVKKLGAPPYSTVCDLCNGQAWQLLLTFRYVALFFVAGVSWDREYLLRCQGCGRTSTQDTATVEQAIGGNKVPLSMRYGLAVLAVGAFLLITFNILNS